MEYTHEQAQRLYDNMEPNEGKDKEPEYCGPTAKDVAMIHYTEFYEIMVKYDMANDFDWHDWLYGKTHFMYNAFDAQWESYTLDLISEGEDE